MLGRVLLGHRAGSVGTRGEAPTRRRRWRAHGTDGCALPGRWDRVSRQAARTRSSRTSSCLPAEGWRSAYLKLRRRGLVRFPGARRGGGRPDGGRRRPRGPDRARSRRLPAERRRTRPPRRSSASASTRELIAQVADLAAGPSKPLDNTDFSHPYRKKVTRVFVARAARRGGRARRPRRRIGGGRVTALG